MPTAADATGSSTIWFAKWTLSSPVRRKQTQVLRGNLLKDGIWLLITPDAAKGLGWRKHDIFLAYSRSFAIADQAREADISLYSSGQRLKSISLLNDCEHI